MTVSTGISTVQNRATPAFWGWVSALISLAKPSWNEACGPVAQAATGGPAAAQRGDGNAERNLQKGENGLLLLKVLSMVCVSLLGIS